MNKILFYTCWPNFMTMTSSERKLGPFCQGFLLETYRKRTAITLECIYQLPQNLTRVHNLVHSFDTDYKNFNFFYSSYCFYYFLLFVFCSNFNSFKGISLIQTINHNLSELKQNWKLHPEQILWHFLWRPVSMEKLLEKCWYQHFEQLFW